MKTKQMTTQMQQHIVAIANTNYRDTTKTDLLELLAFMTEVRYRFHILKLYFTLLILSIDSMKYELIVTSLDLDALVPKKKPSGMPTSDVIKMTLIDPRNLIETGISNMFLYIVGISISLSPQV